MQFSHVLSARADFYLKLLILSRNPKLAHYHHLGFTFFFISEQQHTHNTNTFGPNTTKSSLRTTYIDE